MVQIKRARIHIGDGKVLESADIKVKDGKIQSIGVDLPVEEERVIEGAGMELFPGFIDPVSGYGCTGLGTRTKDNDEVSDPITPRVKARYSFSREEIAVEKLEEIGMTAICASPGSTNIIGGEMALFQTCGANPARMLRVETAALRGSVTRMVTRTYEPRKVRPITRMGIFMELREYLRDLKQKKDLSSAEEMVLQGEIPLIMHAETVAEIIALLEITEEAGITPVLFGAYEFDRCLDLLLRKRVPVIMGELTELSKGNYFSTDLKKVQDFFAEDIPISYSLSSDRTEGRVKYLWNAMEYYRAGISSEQVLQMMSQNAARILRVQGDHGTLEVGKRADLVMYKNHPIETYDAQAVLTMIGGEVVFEREGLLSC